MVESDLFLEKYQIRSSRLSEWDNATPRCLGSIINPLKGACTRRIRSQIDPTFIWQSRFNDHVIRTERNLDDLRSYIQLNPEKTLTHV